MTTSTDSHAASCLTRIGADQNTGAVIGFHAARDGTLLIGTAKGLFRRQGDDLVPIGKDRDTGWVHEFFAASDGTLLVGTENGLFRRHGDELVPIGADQETGRVEEFFAASDGTLLIGTARGLFRHHGDELVPIGADQVASRVTKFHSADDGTLLVGTETGLFRREGDHLFRVGGNQHAGQILSYYSAVFAFHEADDGTLVGMLRGLFRREGDHLFRVGGNRLFGPISELHAASDGTLLIGTTKGLFRRHGDELVRIGKDRATGEVRSFHTAADGTALIGTTKGLFRRHGDELVPIGKDRDTGEVRSFHTADDGTLLIGTTKNLFRRQGDELVPIGADQDTGLGGRSNITPSPKFYTASNGTLLIGTTKGLFRRHGDELVPIGANQNTGWIRAFHAASNGTLLIGTTKGLFRSVQEPWVDAEVAPPSSQDTTTTTTTVLEWTVTHPCAFLLTEDQVSFSGVRDEWIKDREVEMREHAGEAAATIRADINFEEKKDEPYQVQLRVAKEGTNEFVPVGDVVPVRVDWHVPDYIEYYGTRAGTVLFFAHTALFVLLIVGAGWSLFCWRILTDPVWGKTGLWFYFLLRHAGPLQRWVMTPWFEAVRQKTSRQPYLPMSLSDDGEVVGRSTDLLDHDATPRRLWIQGNPGMGKTATVLYLQSAFFADPELPTIAKAFARFRSVPIIVPLREYQGVADPGQPEDWVPSVARMAISAFGVRFEDHGLFCAMIRSGGFVLILDGTNEVERDEEIELFARSAPAVRMLVTSQIPGSTYFTNWHLPRAIHDEIKPLLCLFLGPEKGEQVFARIEPTPLLNAIRSGYDVRLIADLVADQGVDVALPADRLGLYRLIIDTIPMPDGSKFPEESLCKAAWAMWRDGQRKLDLGKHLEEDLLDPLIHEDQKVLRILDGQQFEFRHDQMRAYLAARWAACHEARPISLLENEGAIWRLSRKEQDEVWNFFADMYVAEHPKEAIALWKWSTAHPDRVILQHALQRALKEAGLDPLKETSRSPANKTRPPTGAATS